MNVFIDYQLAMIYVMWNLPLMAGIAESSPCIKSVYDYCYVLYMFR